MTKEKEIFNALKKGIEEHPGWGKDEIVTVACTAALIAAIDRLDARLDELVEGIYKTS